MKTKREKIVEQISLMDDIRSLSKINIVTCGHCGSIVLHKTEVEEIDCPYCNRTLDVCDCPDYLYDNIENNQEFDEPLSKSEYEKLNTLLRELELKKLMETGYHRISGGFAVSSYEVLDDDRISIELKYGVQSDVDSFVTTQMYNLDRKKFQLIQ